MARPKKEETKNRQFRIRLSEKDYNWLDSFSKELNMTKTDVIMSALIGYYSNPDPEWRKKHDLHTLSLILRRKLLEIHDEVMQQLSERIPNGNRLVELQNIEWKINDIARVFGIELVKKEE